MKKLLRILFIVIIVLLAAMITLPTVFKDEILSKSKELINDNLRARVEFEDIRLSLFRRFPNMNVGIKDLSISGTGQFEKDTLIRFDSFDAELDLLSLFRKNIAVEGIYLIQPRLHAKVAADSAVNWDIMKATEETEAEVPDTGAAKIDYRVDLKTFKIEGGHILYEDALSGMQASLDNLNFELKGDLGADSSAIDLHLDIHPVDLQMGAIKYLNQSSVVFDAGIGANLEAGRYYIRDNVFSLNALALNFDGLIEMLEDGRINTDIKFATSKAGFKSLLSMVPAIYMQDFQDLNTSGQLSLQGAVSGYYKDSILPSLDMNLQVENAMFSYPDLPKKAEHIAISLQTYFDGQHPDNTKVNLEHFHIELAGSPFDASFLLMTPLSDPSINGNVKGTIVLDNLADVVPMEETDLKGTIHSDLKLKGSLSMIEQEKYDAFQAEGQVDMKDFYFSGKDLPASVNMDAALLFTPQYLNLKNMDARIGESDLHLSGKLSNYLSYMLQDGIIRGDFNFHSNYLNTNQFLTEGEVEETPDTTEKAELSLFEVPKNIDFKLTSTFDRILYDQMDIRKAKGTILVREEKVYLDGFGMDLFDGQLSANGEYSTQDKDNPYVNFKLGIEDLRIEDALKSFSILDSIAPIMKRAKGDISMDLEYISNLQPNMQPVMKSITGFGELRSDRIVLTGSGALEKILSKLKMDQSSEQGVKNIRVNFILREGNLIVKPFDVRLAGIEMTLSGSQSFDRTMDYMIDMEIPRSAFGGVASQALDNLMAQATSRGLSLDPGQQMQVKANIQGPFSDPLVSLGFGKQAGGPSVKEQVQESVRQVVDKKKQEVEQQVREKAGQKAEKIIEQAQDRAQKVKQEARNAARQIRREADAKADKIEQEAQGKNILVRKAAEKSAEKIRKEADNKADKLVQEADEKAEKIIKQAKEKAENIQND